MQGECSPTRRTPPVCWGCVAELWCFSPCHSSVTRPTSCECYCPQHFQCATPLSASDRPGVFLSPQPQDPEGAVVAEAPSADENPRQVQDELRRVRLRPAGARDPDPTQRDQHLCDHLNRRRAERERALHSDRKNSFTNSDSFSHND